MVITLFLVALVIIVFVLALYSYFSYVANVAYYKGIARAYVVIMESINKVFIPVILSHKDGIFYAHTTKNEFIFQSPSLEDLQVKLSENKKFTYIFSKSTEVCTGDKDDTI